MPHYRISARIKPRAPGNKQRSGYLTDAGHVKKGFKRAKGMTDTKRRAFFAMLRARGDLKGRPSVTTEDRSRKKKMHLARYVLRRISKGKRR